MSRTRTVFGWAFALVLLCSLCTLSVPGSAADTSDSKEFTENFSLYEVDLSPTGRNPFFILEPGYRQVFANEDERLIITVLNKTKTVKGVVCRVVEEQHFENNKLVEYSLNYFAISRKNNSVFYFGEDVDIFDAKGRIISHEGAWIAGKNGAREGLIMPGIVLLGARYLQEIAPEVALDRAQVVGVDLKFEVPAGCFKQVTKTKETTSLEPGVKEFKWYAPGVGLIQDADLPLVCYGFVR